MPYLDRVGLQNESEEDMIKVNTKMQFMGYKPNDGGDLVVVDKQPEKDDTKKATEPSLPGMTLSGFENGMFTGKSVAGKMDLLKDEFHDLLNGEAMDGWAIFAVKIVD